MSLSLLIVETFGRRPPPESLIETVYKNDSDQIDALWFEGRHWRSISRLDWEQHRCAFSAFSPDAFKFYFPSILFISLGDTNHSFDLTHSVIDVLNRSPNPDCWDNFIQSRFLGFTSSEYHVIQEWLLTLAADAAGDFAESLGRCFDTVSLLEKQSAT